MQDTKSAIEELTPVILKKLPEALQAKILAMANTGVHTTGMDAFDWLTEEEQQTIEETVESVLGGS